MPVPTLVDKNIWVAAGDGDLSRVRVSNPLYSDFLSPSTRTFITGVN